MTRQLAFHSAVALVLTWAALGCGARQPEAPRGAHPLTQVRPAGQDASSAATSSAYGNEPGS